VQPVSQRQQRQNGCVSSCWVRAFATRRREATKDDEHRRKASARSRNCSSGRIHACAPGGFFKLDASSPPSLTIDRACLPDAARYTAIVTRGPPVPLTSACCRATALRANPVRRWALIARTHHDPTPGIHQVELPRSTSSTLPPSLASGGDRQAEAERRVEVQAGRVVQRPPGDAVGDRRGLAHAGRHRDGRVDRLVSAALEQLDDAREMAGGRETWRAPPDEGGERLDAMLDLAERRELGQAPPVCVSSSHHGRRQSAVITGSRKGNDNRLRCRNVVDIKTACPGGVAAIVSRDWTRRVPRWHMRAQGQYEGARLIATLAVGPSAAETIAMSKLIGRVTMFLAIAVASAGIFACEGSRSDRHHTHHPHHPPPPGDYSVACLLVYQFNDPAGGPPTSGSSLTPGVCVSAGTDPTSVCVNACSSITPPAGLVLASCTPTPQVELNAC
jgi:hypothetical protein